MARRRRDRVTPDSAEVQIPIPAMLDMVFQILSFFVINFNPPNAAEGQMEMFLPVSGQAKAAAAEQADPFAVSSAEVEPPAEITLAVASEGAGVGKIEIREKEKTTEVFGIKALREQLAILQRQVGRANMTIEAEGGLRYSGLVEVMDACLAAKFSSIGFSPPKSILVTPP